MATPAARLEDSVIRAIGAAAQALAQCKRIGVSTGAGVSAESGVPTFRDAQTGLWAKYDPVMLASIDGFRQDPAMVWKWYDERRQTILLVQPNPGHYALAEWEQDWRTRGREFQLITQNIDDLHARAGSRDVIELHGNIWFVRPLDAALGEAVRLEACPLPEHPPRDSAGRVLRPHVVWFGEQLDPLNVEAAFETAASCEAFLVVGTSAVVYPAAALPHYAKRAGALVVEVNPSATEITPLVDYSLRGPSGVVLPALWQGVKEELTVAGS